MWDKCVVLWGTHWKIEKHNSEHAGTHCEHDENTKIKKFHPYTPGPLPLLCPQGKKMTPLDCMYSHLIGSMQFLYLKLVVTIHGLN
jgi:hypothetical protein